MDEAITSGADRSTSLLIIKGNEIYLIECRQKTKLMSIHYLIYIYIEESLYDEGATYHEIIEKNTNHFY